MRTTLSMIPVLLAGCVVTGDPVRPPAPGTTAPVTEAPVTEAPAIAADGACQLEYGTRVEAAGASYRLVATATNHGATAVTIELPDRCPAGPIVFTGLPTGHDPYGTCTMGMCAGPSAPARHTIEPGAMIELGAGEVDPAGDTCNGALAAGSYSISFVPPTVVDGGAACSPTAATLRHPPASSTPATPHRCEPMPACGIGCPGPMAKDEHGCTLCACEDLKLGL